jgi:serine/threonine protein kinase/thioredoxin-like negative regulator of GroEL
MTVERLRARLAGRYTIERELGAGGMATVYLAQDLRHQRKVAIKVLKPELAAVLGGERFLKEITVTASLQHPHILQLFDSGDADGWLYYVMPFVEGGSLRDRLNHERQLSVEDALRITTTIAGALDFAHKRGVIHRDIKPENIVFQEGVALVADFGIAVAVTSAGGERLTETGLSLGTPAYMSPEQIAGERDLDARSDEYALACVTYEMLAGDPPFLASNAQAVMAKHITDPAPPITTLRPDASPAIAAAIARALRKAPADRFPGAGAFAEALTATEAVADDTSAASIVVLPFANRSPDAENEFFSDGLTEEIIADLASLRALSVISRTSSMRLKGTDKDVRTIGRELGVRYVLEGSVRKAGQSLRITAQLIDAATDQPRWVEKYNGTMDDVFDVQERVARAIVNALQVTLTSSEDVRLAARPIQNARAFELYLEARAEMRRYGVGLDRAQGLLDRAVEIEGASPPLLAMRAFLEFFRVRGGTAADITPLDTAAREAQALVELVPDAPYGHALLGLVAYERGALKDAARHLTRATELDPADPDVLFHLAITYQAAGQIELARSLSVQFQARDPLSPFAQLLPGVSAWFAGRAGQYLDGIERAIALDPENPMVHWAIGYTYALMGRVADAQVHANWLDEHAPQVLYTVQLSTLVGALQGRRAEALEALRGARAAALDAHQTFHLAESFAMAGDTARALQLLERAVDGGFYPYLFIAEYCPFMEPLRRTPEFSRIAAQAERRVAEFGA